jgi:hypothetical protein
LSTFSTIRRIAPDSEEGRRIARELGVRWSRRAETRPLDIDELKRLRYAPCATGVHKRKGWANDI